MATSPQSPNVVLCTGANQGLGFEIVHVTALHNPSAVYLLSCRNVSFGHEAVQQLRQLGVKAEIEVLPLDVTDDEHIIAAVKHVETKYGKLDGKSSKPASSGYLTLPISSAYDHLLTEDSAHQQRGHRPSSTTGELPVVRQTSIQHSSEHQPGFGCSHHNCLPTPSA